MIKIRETENLGFTSDLHLFHSNIIKYSDRPFVSYLEMNEALRDNHNSVFDKDSIVFNLGDALLLPNHALAAERDKYEAQAESLIASFKGKIYYIPGNHEKDIDIIQKYWTVLPPLVDLTLGSKDDTKHVVLCHYALRVWNRSHHGSYHLFGHSHGNLPDDNGLSLDVGVDTNNYMPYTFDQIKIIMTKRVEDL